MLETGGIFKPENTSLQSQISNNTTLKFWFPVGRYVLFVCKVPYIETVNQVFSKAVLSSKSRGSDSELHQGLHYVPLQNLHDVAHSGDTTLTVDGLTLDVYTFLIEMLNGIEEGGWNLVNSSYAKEGQ